MFEVVVVLSFLFALWVFGRSLILICRKDDCDWLAMPIGLCLVGLIGNMLYFMLGLTVQSIQFLFLGALIPCLVLIFYRGIDRSEWGRVLAVLAIFLLLALPAFIGGEQYFVFRGNSEDHFNYINETLAMWGNPYSAYKNNILALANHPGNIVLAAKNFLPKDILIHGLEYIYIRPAVGLVLAILLPEGRGNIHLLAFLYVTALWALVFPAACFAWKRILEAYALTKNNVLLLIGPPFAYVVGFWGQYIFDINSWSCMASIPLLLALVFQYMRLVQNLIDPSTREGKSIVPQLVVTVVLGAGGYLFYPENTVPHIVFLLAATVVWSWAVRKMPQITSVIALAFFWLAVLLISSIPNWKGTGVPFVIHQIFYGMAQFHWRYFDRYWMGIHGNPFFSTIKPVVLHGLSIIKSFHSYKLGIPPANVFLSHLVNGLQQLKSFEGYWSSVHLSPLVGTITVLANFVLAFIGMFFVTPDFAAPVGLRSVWILITVILAAVAIYSLAGSLCVRFRENQTAIFLKAFLLTGILFLVFLFSRGSLWGFGKELSYLSPYLFLVLCLGLFENAWGRRLIKTFVIIFIVSQIAFGGYRLWAARDPNGIGFNNLTYPSIEGGDTRKTDYRWDINPQEYAHCKGVYLDDSSDPFYREYILEYMKQKFLYQGTAYYSPLPVMTFYELSAGENVGQEPFIPTDCKTGFTKVSDKWETVKR